MNYTMNVYTEEEIEIKNRLIKAIFCVIPEGKINYLALEGAKRDALSDIEREFVELRYEKGMKKKDVAKKLSLGEKEINLVQRHALRKLRSPIVSSYLVIRSR